ncbi:MAG: MATE family efflux transporter [Candidatus Aminicenantes bacterium]
MKDNNTNREILRLAIPNILSNISIPLLGMVDTALMGRLESEIYIGAVALGGIIFNIIYWGFGFLRMGTTGLTAQSYGQEDRKECAAILGRGLLFALGGSVFILALQSVIAWIGFSLLQGDETVKMLAIQYFSIRIYAAPATLGLYVFHGWFLGMQNARYPMVLTIFVNLLNIVFNFVFVLQMGMKADGVALGTVCAQYVGLTLAVGLFFYKYRPIGSLLKWRQVIQLTAIKRFFAINIDIFIRTVCLVFTFAFFTSASAAFDSMTLAANQILLQYISLMSYAVDGFAFAAESLVGKYTGARDPALLRLSVRYLFYWGIGFGAVFALVYGALGRALLRVFTDQAEIIQAASPYVWWVVVISVAGSVAYMWDGVYIGATATSSMRNMMLISTLVIFLPVYYITVSPLGNNGLWLALFFFMVARGISLGLLAKKRIYSRMRKK